MSRPSRKLSLHLQQLRQELHGEDGIPELAKALGLPAKTWENYEAGVSIPSSVLLDFLELTGASPHWLLTGEGERFQSRPVHGDRQASNSGAL